MRKIASSEKHPDTLAAEDPRCASWNDWLDWFIEDPDVKLKYLEAISLQAMYSAGYMFEVANGTTNDNWCYTQAVLGQKRWSAKTLVREIFGDKLQVEHKQIRAEEWIELMKEPEEVLIGKE